ncbi:hypothetical protein [Marinobacter segnicrescens]|uniref:hypothetical protein n=1 Tax=Marinobacter segnicrescens TaxID=430453 RepID=UPI003A93F213
MTFNAVKTGIASLISALLAFAFYSFSQAEVQWLVTIGAFVFFITTLILGVGVEFDRPRAAVNLKVIALTSFGLALFSNLLFALVWSSVVAYIVTNGILFLMFLLFSYLVVEAKQ